MQKLLVELKNTPKDAPQVPCSVNSQLNKDQSLSVENIVLADNNVEVDQSQHTERLKVKVYVISKEGFPLMPCSCAKAKHLLKAERARVIKRMPFTIQLNFECENQVQDITLGIDAGYSYIGFSAVSEKSELISGTLKLDGRTKERLEKKKLYRKSRRARLWYRKRRYSNRANARKKGILMPSIKRRYLTHLKLIERIKKLLPITSIIIETAKFDFQQIINVNSMLCVTNNNYKYSYNNIKNYLFSKQQGLCEHCRKNFINSAAHMHHRTPKNKGGSDRAENLMLVHKKCHEKIHKSFLLLKKYSKETICSFKSKSFMNSISKRLSVDVNNVQITFGYITHVNRVNLQLCKSHINDAFIIAQGYDQCRIRSFIIQQKHKNNRCLQLNRKGYKKSIRKSRSIIQPLDLIWVNKKQYIAKGMFDYGNYILYGSMKNKEWIKTKMITKYFQQTSLCWGY